MVILKVWYVCQIICIAGDVQRQKKLWARHLIASGSLIRVSVVNDTLPPDFSRKLLTSNFVTFLMLVGFDFS